MSLAPATNDCNLPLYIVLLQEDTSFKWIFLLMVFIPVFTSGFNSRSKSSRVIDCLIR